MMLNYLFYNSTPKYENKIEKKKKDDMSSLQSCIENASITLILVGSILVVISLLMSTFFADNLRSSSVYKLFCLTSGLWLVIIIAQVLTFLFSSTIFQNSTHLFLNDQKGNAAHKWNPLSTGLFLTNVITFSCVSVLSFCGIFSYVVSTFSGTNGRLLASTIFSFSLNLVFMALQFIYILIRIHKIKGIKFSKYLPFFLPGFSCMLESIAMNVKHKMEQSLLDKKSKRGMHKKKLEDHVLHHDENIFLIN
ncbi:conserved Plasmodium protein, unknown function [Plasmodium knowlesi strain H]|uniref:Uncharacterized protein n=3 Tax=Plasmodium knowlesi TaxID=5850 RepID=A0A5K1VHF8_PLAKH|nr:conserved Plasmodium protein, unknown function [Plasmodium knowlesi strain H]OTN64738.1 Uncharacterized protein PKNOH_S130176100 [Plasmodium knowlesi]CAA9988929.1 conserved Plasmodium protein, unknown function [Plasmodium knowlesi strain H]SBO24774.1 conserved Plasmodium protein, unknown function [Plasmodium knowlesi strain H]SBO28038.1 conserved Plasmodium protein, unknown function [Plasmodium knowlesi strain H]VVS78403.1 conserved Plasmodium protein, unknown function [Plasmodium knowlesi |eukprot:XP_002261276.1 hypothetical protein, conserved in Plasmodium species [Plasmodium knowlesi strain H]